MTRLSRFLLVAAAILFACSSAWSQGIFATITGIISDPSGAVVPGAKVILQNAASGDNRQTTSDAQGYYTFASVSVGTYNLVVNHQGFQKFEEQGIPIGGGDLRTLNVSLKLGAETQTVEVNAVGDILTPEDSGEQTITLSTVQLQNYVQTGSDAAEFIKMMPGFGIQNGVSNQSGYTGEVIGINANGNGGSQSPLNNNFTYDGLPGNTLDIVSDGAHVSDPGCNCDTPVNPNSDFLQEFKVLSDDYSAEEQKGPMVITSVTKAGGAQFHGEGLFEARNYTLNANDAYNKELGAARPQNKFYYEGGDIGGPILKSRKKLFFFGGFEYYGQTLDTGVLTGTVPVPSMLTGDFSAGTLSQLGPAWYGPGGSGATQHQVCTPATDTSPGTACAGWANGQMPSNLIDPSMQALMKLYPKPNTTPTTSNGGFNYVQTEIFNQNDTQLLLRGDYDISENTKVWARWNWQTEVQPFPIQLWGSNAVDQMPYPTSVLGRNRSNSIAATITHTFSPTLTNEGVFAWTRILFPNVFADPSKVDPSTIGYTDPTLYNHTTPTHMMPNFGGDQWSGQQEAGFFANYGGFYLGGAGQGLFANKWMPSFSDTVTKVFRTHTIAAGMFYEWIKNAQPDSGNSQGTAQFNAASNSLTYGDSYADELGGNLQDYSETNFNRLDSESYYTIEAFAQDTWVIRPRLTLNYGVRFTHFEPWVDDEHDGYSIWVPSQYSSANGGACAATPTFCGFEWHKQNPSVPLAGFPTRTLFYQPRIGLSYDLRGDGKTVIRGGWGYFFYHTGQFTSGLDTSAGEASATVSPSSIGSNGVAKQLLESQLGSVPFNSAVSSPTPVNSTDDKEPYTEDYNVTIEQRTPWSGLAALAYIGNVSRDLPSGGGYGSDVNLIPLGTLTTGPNAPAVPGQANVNNFRPFVGYGQINMVVNNTYSNYNSLQARWAHQSSKILMQLNYTWSKAMGIVSCSSPTLGGLCGATLNPFVLGDNYGPLPSDRRQLFNAVYNFNLPSPIHDNKLLGGVVNGWQISGLTSLQSGANLTGNAGYNWNMNLNSAVMPGTPTTGPDANYIGNQSIYGTPDISFTPLVTCNPHSGLAAHQYVNPSCFGVSTTVGQGGPFVLPTEYGPAYFNSDLGIFKNFRIGSREDSKLQIRAEAQNFLNHPLRSFPNNNNLSLSFQQQTAQSGGQTVGTSTFTQTNSNFGVAQYLQGHRIVELTAKYYF